MNEQFKARLAQLDWDDPLLVGLRAMLDAMQKDYQMLSYRADKTADYRAFVDGCGSAVDDLQAALRQEWESARK